MTTKRISSQPNEVLERGQPVPFIFNGKPFSAYRGDTIASALAANGVQVFSRSFKYHRPRGLLCCSGDCPNCLVQVGPEMNVRSCTTPVEPGMVVEPQNAWPSLDIDIMSLTEAGSALLPPGFYYKTFIRPKALWPLYEEVLRHAAGLGKVDLESRIEDFDKEYLHAEVAVVGGGPAGMRAALAAADQGARTLIFDDQPSLGGHQRYRSNHDLRIADMSAAIDQHPLIQVFTTTTVLGLWEENWLAAVSASRLFKIRAKTLIVATGAYEQPLVFENNDLPGVMLGSAVQRLLHLYGVLPGMEIVIVTSNDDGWQVAEDLRKAGGTVVAVADERSAEQAPELAETLSREGVPVFWEHTVQRARGGKVIREATLVRVSGNGVDEQSVSTIACDLLVTSVGWAPANGLLYQTGAEIKYDADLAEFISQKLPPGVFAAGRVLGTHLLQIELDEGKIAGSAAAAYTGYGVPLPQRSPKKTRVPGWTSPRISAPGAGKKFLCYCEDVTHKDLKRSIEEGYDSIELLKRYSTISMGPCQGKMCSVNTVHLCARANDSTVEETGTTTARPPMTPVKLGSLAGQNMEPIRYSPVHSWHTEHRARMMIAGLWMRPEHYGDPIAEVKAVRSQVGLIDISTLGKLQMTGPGVPELLNKLYVNQWLKLGIGRVRYGVMCSDEGVVMDDGVTARLGETEWLTTTTSSGAAAIYEWIQWWVQSGWGEGVHVTNVTEKFAAFNLAGPHSRALLQGLTGADLSNESFPYMHVRELEIGGVPCRLFRIGFTGELSYEIHTPAGYGQQLWEMLMEAGSSYGISPFGVEAQRILRLEKGHIIVGQDTDALSDPIAADMAWVVKHDKPNFLGNRPLARIQAQGPAQKLVGFRVQTPGVVPEEGLQIIEKGGDRGVKIIGWVTSSRYSPTLDAVIGLCWLPAAQADQEGSSFSIHRNGGVVEAKVHHGPFYDSAGARLRS